VVYSPIEAITLSPNTADGGAAWLLGDDARSGGRRVVVASSADRPLDTPVSAVLSLVAFYE
jgi:hypothetical protein